MSGGGINHHLSKRYWEVTLGASLIEITKANAYSYLSTLLPYMNNVGELCMVLNFFNELSCYEFIYFNNNLLLKFMTKSPLSLLKGLEHGGDG